MSYKNRLSELRGDLTQAAFAKKLGMSQQNYGNYENGKQPLKSDQIALICETFGCTAEWLLGMSDVREPIAPVDCFLPMVGAIPAGTPLEAIELGDERAWCDPSISERHPRAFFLTVHGDSMDLRYRDGGMVLIDPDEREIESGKCYAVLVNGYDATLKQVFVAGDTIVLHPLSTNQAHKDRSIDVTDPDAPYFAVVGRVVWYVSKEE